MIVVFGATRSGKDTVARYLVGKLGYKFIVSYTDRPIRDTEVNGREHLFISTEDMDKIYKSDTVTLKTHIVDPVESLKDRNYRGYSYCTKKEDLNDKTVAILDYNGIVELAKSDIEFKTILVTSPYKVRKDRALSTNIDLKTFEKRCKDEYSQFVDNCKRYADFVVDNSGTLEELYSNIDKIIKSM